jgi:Glycosyl hydrolase family 26
MSDTRRMTSLRRSLSVALAAAAVVAPVGAGSIHFVETPRAASAGRAVHITFRSPGVSAVRCRLDGAPPRACRGSFRAAGLRRGPHVLRVSGTRGHGRIGVSLRWRVTDPSPKRLAAALKAAVTVSAASPAAPLVPGLPNPPGVPEQPPLAVVPLQPSTPEQQPTLSLTSITPMESTQRSLVIDFVASDATTVSCAIDSGVAAPCSSPATFSGLSVGTHGVTVVAANAGGSVTRSVSATAGIALGVREDGFPGDVGALGRYATTAGRPPSMVMWFDSFSWPLLVSSERTSADAVVAQGALPVITWEPTLDGGTSDPAYSPSAIASGSQDAYLIQSAKNAAAWGHPFLLRFAHEMNANWYSWGSASSGGAADYVAMWRHVVSIFRAEGATNARFVWSPNVQGYSENVTAFAPFYPGDAYVDYVALDAYNGLGTWRSFAQLIGPSYSAITALTSKPLLIGELACAEGAPDAKAAWMTQALLHDIPDEFPLIRGIIWYDKTSDGSWPVTTSPSALAAWRDAVTDSRYSAPLLASSS